MGLWQDNGNMTVDEETAKAERRCCPSPSALAVAWFVAAGLGLQHLRQRRLALVGRAASSFAGLTVLLCGVDHFFFSAKGPFVDNFLYNK
jgi:hypothetical protein